MSVYMDAAQVLLACYRTALEAGPVPPAQICLRHGQQVTPQLGTNSDECCSGLAWVRIVSVERLRSLDDDTSMCAGAERRLTLEMGAVRCLPWGTVQDPATCDQWEAVTLQADADHAAMEAALCCAWGDLTDGTVGEAAMAGEYVPTGPDGNCIGGTMQVVVDTSCGCSTEGG